MKTLDEIDPERVEYVHYTTTAEFRVTAAYAATVARKLFLLVRVRSDDKLFIVEKRDMA